jgi:hypothetical protein
VAESKSAPEELVTVLLCPGRTTNTHDQFIEEFPAVRNMKILTIDAASANMPYASGSNELVLCSNEKYHLEMHKFLTIPPAHRYIRECWENEFDFGRNTKRRGLFLASFNNFSRKKKLESWNDLAVYYCVLAMSGFNVSYNKWRLIGEHCPVTPAYDEIKVWSQLNKSKTIRYYRRNVYNFPTTEIDDNTLVYIHLPNIYASYGCQYVWTKRKFESVVSDLVDLAGAGSKICISFLHEKWGRKVTMYSDILPADVFTPHYYSELKASRYGFNAAMSVEGYFVANL